MKNERLDGYMEAHKKHKLPVDESLIVSTDLSVEGTRNAVDALLQLKKRPTAILSFNDVCYARRHSVRPAKKLAINKEHLFCELCQRAGYPICGISPLASVEQFPYDQGVSATELLFRLIDKKVAGHESPYENIVLKSELIIR